MEQRWIGAVGRDAAATPGCRSRSTYQDHADMADDAKDETQQMIVDLAVDAQERHDSQVLYQALRGHAAELAGGGAIPPEDRTLSERILAEARVRSQQISAGRGVPAATATSGPLAPAARPIPWWLIVAWIVAVAAAVAAFKYL